MLKNDAEAVGCGGKDVDDASVKKRKPIYNHARSDVEKIIAASW
jgi:hypothetical protein